MSRTWALNEGKEFSRTQSRGCEALRAHFSKPAWGSWPGSSKAVLGPQLCPQCSSVAPALHPRLSEKQDSKGPAGVENEAGQVQRRSWHQSWRVWDRGALSARDVERRDRLGERQEHVRAVPTSDKTEVFFYRGCGQVENYWSVDIQNIKFIVFQKSSFEILDYMKPEYMSQGQSRMGKY